MNEQAWSSTNGFKSCTLRSKAVYILWILLSRKPFNFSFELMEDIFDSKLLAPCPRKLLPKAELSPAFIPPWFCKMVMFFPILVYCFLNILFCCINFYFDRLAVCIFRLVAVLFLKKLSRLMSVPLLGVLGKSCTLSSQEEAKESLPESTLESLWASFSKLAECILFYTFPFPTASVKFTLKWFVICIDWSSWLLVFLAVSNNLLYFSKRLPLKSGESGIEVVRRGDIFDLLEDRPFNLPSSTRLF